jgi:hypothetical protein
MSSHFSFQGVRGVMGGYAPCSSGPEGKTLAFHLV